MTWDYAVAQVAKAVGRTTDAAYFLGRSKNYRKLYNRATGFMQARDRDGSWAPDGWGEGDQWAYTADVLHDIPGLISLKGGNAAFASWLDDHFGGGHNDPTNEPSHHIPYLYDYAGRPWKTQQLVREIAAANFHATPDGLPGNDDCGQMSTWYVFSALGFYPVNPASGQYAVTSPLFDKVTLDLPGSARPLVITAAGTATRPYIQALNVNGRTVGKPFLTHADLARGGNLDFTMNRAPSPGAPPPPRRRSPSAARRNDQRSDGGQGALFLVWRNFPDLPDRPASEPQRNLLFDTGRSPKAPHY